MEDHANRDKIAQEIQESHECGPLIAEILAATGDWDFLEFLNNHSRHPNTREHLELHWKNNGAERVNLPTKLSENPDDSMLCSSTRVAIVYLVSEICKASIQTYDCVKNIITKYENLVYSNIKPEDFTPDHNDIACSHPFFVHLREKIVEPHKKKPYFPKLLETICEIIDYNREIPGISELKPKCGYVRQAELMINYASFFVSELKDPKGFLRRLDYRLKSSQEI